jgi:hypothetical protein
MFMYFIFTERVGGFDGVFFYNNKENNKKNTQYFFWIEIARFEHATLKY